MVIALVAVIVERTTGDGDPQESAPTSTMPTTTVVSSEAVRLQGEVDQALAGAATATIDLLRQQQEWRTGDVADEDMSSALGAAFPRFVEARDALVDLAADHPSGAIPLYLRATQLYVEWLRATSTTIAAPPGPLRTELDKSARRLYELGDRVYDHAKAQLVGVDTGGDGVEIRPVEPVPDWGTTGLAPGPPVAAPASTAPATTSTTDQRSWEARVRDAAVPEAEAVGAAVDSDDASALASLGEAFVESEYRLRGAPIPGGEDNAAQAIRVRLSLLLGAEAMWRAEAARLTDDGPLGAALARSARRLVLVSDGVWPPELTSRRTIADRGELADSQL